jgi:hypothetical protein
LTTSEVLFSDTPTPVPEEEKNKESDPIREWCNQISTTHLRQNKRSEANAKRQADDLLGESSHESLNQHTPHRLIVAWFSIRKQIVIFSKVCHPPSILLVTN